MNNDNAKILFLRKHPDMEVISVYDSPRAYIIASKYKNEEFTPDAFYQVDKRTGSINPFSVAKNKELMRRIMRNKHEQR